VPIQTIRNAEPPDRGKRRRQDYATKANIAAAQADIAALPSDLATMVDQARNAVLLSIFAATFIIIAAVGLLV